MIGSALRDRRDGGPVGQVGQNVIDGAVDHRCASSVGGRGDVGRGEHVRQRKQRVTGVGDRLDFEHVESRRVNLVGSQCLDQGGLVNDRATRRIHERRSGFHERKFTLPNEVARRRVERNVHGNHVARGEEVVKRSPR